jgi:hypothetical protein
MAMINVLAGPDVTLAVTLGRANIVTLGVAVSFCRRRLEGYEVEEVEDPPFSSGQGDKAR